jgi:hypothetical protein
MTWANTWAGVRYYMAKPYHRAFFGVIGAYVLLVGSIPVSEEARAQSKYYNHWKIMEQQYGKH